MTLTYIFHSCFIIETDSCLLVFDYWMDPADIVPQRMKTDKQIYVFSSHFHEDHFTPRIFEWKRCCKNIKYILSKDILKHRKADKDEADVWMAKGCTWEDNNIKAVATGSNDSGVSWVIDIEGKRIFHAGDLCNWYAHFLTEETPDKEIYSEMSGIYVNPVVEEKHFLGELKDIHKVTDRFDLVMFPVDGRIGNGYTLGGRQFIERFNVGMFVPMHFVVSGFESAWRMEPFCKEKGVSFWEISKEGDTIEI